MSAAVAISFVCGAVVSLISGGLLFARLRRVPAARRLGSGAPPRISVIIPARDEAANLGRLLPSLATQTTPAHEILVIDDQSRDDSAAVAGRHGATVISGEDLPDGWYGKPWACQQGAGRAGGDWLLFLDADLRLEPDALERFGDLVDRDPGAVFSICPWHAVEKPYEQGSVFFNLLMLGGIGAFTFRGHRAAGIGLFGQSMLISRTLYREVGGHRRVRRTVLENFHLAREFERLGISRKCYLGEGCVSMRMFPGGPREMIDSWTKGFSSGAGLSSRLGLVLASVWLSGLMMMTVSLFLLPLLEPRHLPPVAAAHLAVALSLAWLFRRAGRFRWWNALGFPASLMFYQWAFMRSVIRKRRGEQTQWKGRDVA